MKRLFLSFIIAMGLSLPGLAIDYNEAQRQAWFLTDKMAYELNLTEEQCNRAYEINLDYLLNVSSANDVYGTWWGYRNADFRFVLFDWQYARFLSTAYFYRPVRWLNVGWHWNCHDHYRRDYYYFNRPVIVNVYRGRRAVAHHRNYRSPYRNMTFRSGNGLRDRHYRNNPPRRENSRPGNHSSGSFHMRSDGKMEWKNRPNNSQQPHRNNGDRPTRQESNTNRPPVHNASDRPQRTLNQTRNGQSEKRVEYNRSNEEKKTQSKQDFLNQSRRTRESSTRVTVKNREQQETRPTRSQPNQTVRKRESSTRSHNTQQRSTPTRQKQEKRTR